jgi:3-oxoadipate CoA-transferase, beta subunit
MPAFEPLTRAQMAARVALDIRAGWYVNLGIGIPTQIADYIDPAREIVIHSENGILGMGPAPAAGAADPWLINAGKQPVTLVRGAAFMHHADSFAIVRGRHLDLCVLGAFEVSEDGDLANWAAQSETAPAVGGAMDLAVGAKRIWVVMEHTTRDGSPKLVHHCAYPLTAAHCVRRVYTNLAVLDVVDGGFKVLEIIHGLDHAGLQAKTEAPLHF